MNFLITLTAIFSFLTIPPTRNFIGSSPSECFLEENALSRTMRTISWASGDLDDGTTGYANLDGIHLEKSVENRRDLQLYFENKTNSNSLLDAKRTTSLENSTGFELKTVGISRGGCSLEGSAILENSDEKSLAGSLGSSLRIFNFDYPRMRNVGSHLSSRFSIGCSLSSFRNFRIQPGQNDCSVFRARLNIIGKCFARLDTKCFSDVKTEGHLNSLARPKISSSFFEGVAKYSHSRFALKPERDALTTSQSLRLVVERQRVQRC